MAQARDLQHEFYDMLMESQYWLPETMLDYQRSQLAQLLRHARANVPFYEKRLDPVFTATGDIDWGRWEEIPIVTRHDMSAHRAAMLALEVPLGHGQSSTVASSGSTGEPVQITSNRLTFLTSNANRWRAQRWHDLDWSAAYTARIGSDARSVYPHGLTRGRWGPSWDAAAQLGQAFELHSDATMRENLEFIRRTGSRYYSTGPKTLHVLALEAERLGLELKLHYVLAQGGHMDDEDKAACRRVFGARSLELYSSKEGGPIAYPCDHGTGMHVNSESVLVEIVDEAGHAVAPGASGRVIITPFVSTAQPLIRYEQGDIARFGPPCTCGRHLPVLAAIEGRSIAIFSHPDGRQIATMLGSGARTALNCSFWQIAQVGPLQFEVRYVPRDGSVVADEASARSAFHAAFFPDAEVRFVPVREIPLTAAGKYIEYINEWARTPPRP
ncbi:phenylacetate--CoA ligase family protein [Devosia sp. Root413D1]|uniref:phenylacetate--CoA ligase family protein n=1 Tax=Devosia sp. Root413D1 TaxID=1736531 RepID=UPI0012E3F60E|nr:phenylacetate--CoA ligase family protein [Devosia sp. Root413D1]